MKLTFERKLPIILFFVFLMMAAVGFVFYQNTVSMQEAIEWEKKSQGVIFYLENTMAVSLDAEAEVRAFVTTGNGTYVDLYNKAKTRANGNMTELRTLIGDDATQIEELHKLELILGNFWEVTGQKIDRRKQLGPEARDIDVSIRDTRSLLDAIRASTDTMKNREAESLRSKGRSLENGLYWTVWILIVTSLAGAASLGVANFMVWHEGRKRAAAEDKLRETNRDLEKTVDRRTDELRRVNESLIQAAAEKEKLLRNETKAREEVEIANRLRDEFMASVSHELRTPLNSILGWARMMKSGSLDDRQSAKAVKTIIKNSETQNRLIEDLLDVARIISGKVQIETVEIDLSDIVGHAYESTLPSAEAKSITMRMNDNVGPGVAFVQGDRGRMEQIFTNLLTNAVKFTPEGGNVEIDISPDGKDAEVSVRDSGVGISAEFLPLVFERFRQEIGNEKNNGGLGLGLAIVRNLVELHGGTVSAHSEGEDKGAVFIVRLPLAKQQPTEAV
ncbi:MAG: CHASE3 domain-containing protein [Acidobacteria bacterium]|nr:CHASE3 domain-containing protein [Acidobacteriota bacterium]